MKMTGRPSQRQQKQNTEIEASIEAVNASHNRWSNSFSTLRNHKKKVALATLDQQFPGISADMKILIWEENERNLKETCTYLERLDSIRKVAMIPRPFVEV